MATIMEIGIEMKRLTDAMPAPRGVDPAKAYAAYETALIGFPADAIKETIDRYLSGAFPKISLKFYPRAPELAACVRQVMAERGAAEQEARRKHVMAEEDREIAECDARKKARTPEEVARVAATYRDFLDRHEAAAKARARDQLQRSRAEIRARYGMTDEVLAGVPDRPLPKGMRQAGAAVPGIPAPRDEAEDLR